NLYTCPKCGWHFRIGSDEYIEIILDDDSFVEIGADMVSDDPLEFVDEKSYRDRLLQARRKTGLNDAMRAGTGTLNGRGVVLAAMDFSFIGGSMGSVVGEKFSRAADAAMENRFPLIAVTASGGARM